MESHHDYPMPIDLPEVSSTSTLTAAPTHHHATPTSCTVETMSAKAARAVNQTALTVTAPSSTSYGETVLVHASGFPDTTTTPTSCASASVNVEHTEVNESTASIELSPVPSEGLFESTLDDSAQQCEATRENEEMKGEEDGDKTINICSDATYTPQDVWTRQVYVHSGTAATADDSSSDSVVLSSAAANIIARALHRATVLRDCMDCWVTQHERHAQRRRHQECFAQSYYEHNLLYLLYRAWEWRLRARQRRTTLSENAVQLRKGRLCRRVFSAWRRQCERLKETRWRIQEMQLQARFSLRAAFYHKWQRCCAMRAQAKQLRDGSLSEVRQRFFAQWRAYSIRCQRRRLVAQVISTHTPHAWCREVKEHQELQLRFSWLQWLRVTMQRRASKLQRLASATVQLTQQTAQTHLRSRYTLWLQVTFASLQGRELQRALRTRYFSSWQRVADVTRQGKRWATEEQQPRVLRRCWQLWTRRCAGRNRQRRLQRLADTFVTSVMYAHMVKSAFSLWRQQWAGKDKERRMRRVAEAYARPALLRHLFVRHVTDSVLSAVEPATTETIMESSSTAGVEWQDSAVRSGADASEEESGWTGPATHQPPLVSLTFKRALTPPIPIEAPTNHASLRHVSRAQEPMRPTHKPADAVMDSPAVAVVEPTSAAVAVAPPPPTYAETMRWDAEAAAAAAAAVDRGACKPPPATRRDAAVGTVEDDTAPRLPSSDAVTHHTRDAAVEKNPHACQPSCVAVGGVFYSLPQQLLPSTAVIRTTPYTSTFSAPYNTDTRLPLLYATPNGCLQPPQTLCCVDHAHPYTVPNHAAYLLGHSDAYRSASGSAAEVHPEQQLARFSHSCAASLCVPAAASADLRATATGGSSSEGGSRAHAARSGVPRDSHTVFSATHPVQCSLPASVHAVAVPSPAGSQCCDGAAVDESTPHLGEWAHRTTDKRSVRDEEGAAGCCGHSPRKGSSAAFVTRELPLTTSVNEPARDCENRQKIARSLASLPPAVSASMTHGRLSLKLSDSGERLATERPTMPTHSTDDDEEASRRFLTTPSLAHQAESVTSSASCPCSLAAPEVPPDSHSSSFLTLDSAALRSTARELLRDYQERTRLHTSESAELATVTSRLALEKQLGLSTAEREAALRQRQRYLQIRELEWEQRRAQLAQLTVLLERRVRAGSTAASSRAGDGN